MGFFLFFLVSVLRDAVSLVFFLPRVAFFVVNRRGVSSGGGSFPDVFILVLSLLLIGIVGGSVELDAFTN